MGKALKNAVKREKMIQALSAIKISGSVDERAYARCKLSNGLTSRYQGKQALPKAHGAVILGGSKRLLVATCL